MLRRVALLHLAAAAVLMAALASVGVQASWLSSAGNWFALPAGRLGARAGITAIPKKSRNACQGARQQRRRRRRDRQRQCLLHAACPDLPLH